MRHTTRALCFSLATLSTFPRDAAAERIRVPADHASIQEAIDAAVDGDSVLVSRGTYREHLRIEDKRLVIASVDGAGGAATTRIDGGKTGRVVEFNGSEVDGSLLVGFTLIRGTASIGGGVLCNRAAPIIANCEILRCTANKIGGTAGGGIHAEYAAPVLVDCHVDRNSSALGSGGGLGLVNSDATILRCLIEGNSEENQGGDQPGGGGIAVCGGTVTIAASIVRGNYSSGIFAHGYGTRLILRNCILGSNGFYGRTNDGLSCEGVSSVMAINCTIINNFDYGIALRGDFSSVRVQNSIVWGNRDGDLRQGGGSLDVDYCDVGGPWPGQGNLSVDPLLTDWRDLYRTPTPSSPCVDAGSPALEDGISDWHPWWPPWYPNQVRSDMGAYGGPGNRLWVR